VQHDEAGNVRSSLARDHIGGVPAARPVEVDLGAGGRDVDRRPVVAKFREGVVAVVEEQPTAAIAARLAVEVGHRRDGDDLGERSGNESGRVDGRVAGRGDVRDARGDRGADRLADAAVRARPDAADVAEAHVRDADVVRWVGVGGVAGGDVDCAGQVQTYTCSAYDS